MKKTGNEKNLNKIETIQRELTQKEDQIISLISQIKSKDETVKYYSINKDHNVRSQGIINTEIDKLKIEKIEFLDKISNLERQLEDFYINRKSESGLLLEIEHLKDDNLRLLGLLKHTEDYKDFAYLGEDNSGGVMFIKGNEEKQGRTANRPQTSKMQRSSSSSIANGVKQHKSKDFETSTQNDENWVPVEV